MEYDTKEILMAFTAFLAFLAFVVSLFAYRISKKAQEQSLLSLSLSHANTFIGFFRVHSIEGQELKGEFTLINHGEKSLTLKEIEISGRGESSVGDDYGVLDIILDDELPRVIEGSKEIRFESKFLIGVGELKRLNLNAQVRGINAYHESFRVSIPVSVQLS